MYILLHFSIFLKWILLPNAEITLVQTLLIKLLILANIEYNKADQSSIESYNEDLCVYHNIFDKNGLIFLNQIRVKGKFNNYSVEKAAESIQCPFKNAVKKECIEYIIEEQQKNYSGMFK